MARAKTPKSKKTRAAAKHDSLAVTRAVPALDELAQTREGEVVGADWSGVGFTKDAIAEEASRATSAYLASRVSAAGSSLTS